jgi:hypothetical protein
MSTNVYKRFDPRVMEREERIGINRGLQLFVFISEKHILGIYFGEKNIGPKNMYFSIANSFFLKFLGKQYWIIVGNQNHSTVCFT